MSADVQQPAMRKSRTVTILRITNPPERGGLSRYSQKPFTPKMLALRAVSRSFPRSAGCLFLRLCLMRAGVKPIGCRGVNRSCDRKHRDGKHHLFEHLDAPLLSRVSPVGVGSRRPSVDNENLEFWRASKVDLTKLVAGGVTIVVMGGLCFDWWAGATAN